MMRLSLRLGTVLAALTLGALLARCTPTSVPYRGSIYFGGKALSLRYEGSCAQLACCSSYATPVPAQTAGAFRCDSGPRGCVKPGWFAPGFTCDPHVHARYRQPGDAPFLGCDDNERWLSLPNLTHEYCGQQFLVCYRGRRVFAVVRDKSARNDSGHVHYEGSLGLLRAIGADPAARETLVSIYALDEEKRIANDPECAGGER